MPTLTGLPGVKKKYLECEYFKTPAECLEILSRLRAASAAGENGCINVWVDSRRNLRGHVQQFQQTIESSRFISYEELSEWLEPRLIQIEKPNPAAASALRKIMERGL